MASDLTPIVVSQQPDPRVPGGMRHFIRVTTFGSETHFAYFGNDPAIWQRLLRDSHLPGGPRYVAPIPPMLVASQQNASMMHGWADAAPMAGRAEVAQPASVPQGAPMRQSIPISQLAPMPQRVPPAQLIPMRQPAQMAPMEQPAGPAPVPASFSAPVDVHAVSLPPYVPIREREALSHPWQDTTIHAPYDPSANFYANRGPRQPGLVPPAQPIPTETQNASYPAYAHIPNWIRDELRKGRWEL